MPYVAPHRRARLDAVRPLGGLPTYHPINKGELNYVLAREVDNFLKRQDRLGYQTLSDAVGACDDLAAELRRRFLEPYEDQKINDNGDVFTFQDGG